MCNRRSLFCNNVDVTFVLCVLQSRMYKVLTGGKLKSIIMRGVGVLGVASYKRSCSTQDYNKQDIWQHGFRPWEKNWCFFVFFKIKNKLWLNPGSKWKSNPPPTPHSQQILVFTLMISFRKINHCSFVVEISLFSTRFLKEASQNQHKHWSQDLRHSKKRSK